VVDLRAVVTILVEPQVIILEGADLVRVAPVDHRVIHLVMVAKAEAVI